MSSDFDESASTDVASTDAGMAIVMQSPGANILSELGEASGQASPKQHVGGRDAMLSSQGQTSKDSSRLSTGDCNLLLNPPVNAAYELWLQKRNTAKKGLCWSFLDKVHSSKGMYPEVWRCIGCWPDVALFNVSYEATKDAAKLPAGIMRYGKAVEPNSKHKAVTGTSKFSLLLRGINILDT